MTTYVRVSAAHLGVRIRLMARVLVLRQAPLSRDPRSRQQVEALAAAGHEVDVVEIPAPGEARWERRGAVTFLRVPVLPRRGRPSRYVWEYGSFFVACFAVAAARSMRQPYDIVAVHTLPDALVFAAFPARLRGAKVLLDLHEPMPEFFQVKWDLPPGHRLTRVVAAVEQAAIRFADHVTTCTDQLRDRFVERGADPAKVTVVVGASDETVFTTAPAPAAQPGRLRLVSHGSIEARYGLDTAIEAIALLDDLPGITFDIYGDGSDRDRLRKLAADLGVAHRVTFSDGYVPIDQLVAGLHRADCGYVGIKRDDFRDLVLCLKLYDFVAVGRPAVVARTRSVEEYFGDGCFELFDSGDAADLAVTLRRLADDPDRRRQLTDAAAAAGEGHRWSVSRGRFLAVVDHLLGRGPLPEPEMRLR